MIRFYEDNGNTIVNGFDLSQISIKGSKTEDLFDLMYELKMPNEDKKIYRDKISSLKDEIKTNIQKITDLYKEVIIGEMNRYMQTVEEMIQEIKKSK